jgi:hypothetical protein
MKRDALFTSKVAVLALTLLLGAPVSAVAGTAWNYTVHCPF